MPSETVATPGGWGRNIAAARTRLGLTQQNLAERLNVSPTTIARWEQARRPPGWADQVRLAEALEQPITSLFPRTDDEATIIDELEAVGRGCS